MPGSGMKDVKPWFAHHKLTCLLLAVLAALMMLPFERSLFFFGYRLLMLIILGAGIYTVSHRRDYVLIGLLMGVPAVALSLVITFGYSHSLSTMTAQSILQILFYIYTITLLLNFLLSRFDVSMNMIHGAICTYVLIGILWANAYTLVELYIPGSFRITHYLLNPMNETAAHVHTFFHLAYFSFTTMTTVAFGDIVPTSDPARWLAASEGFVGQLYIAVLVARLVGLYIGTRIQPKDISS